MKILLTAVLIIIGFYVTAQTGIGTTTPNASAQLDVSSTTKGFLPPRMSVAQRTSISNPATGLLVYQTDLTSGYYFYTGAAWSLLTSNGVPYTGANSNVDIGMYKLTSGGILPKTNSNYNLGSSSLFWNKLYVSSLTSTTGYSFLSSSGSTTTISNAGTTSGYSTIKLTDLTVQVKGNLIPLDFVGDYSLGSSSDLWTAVYATNGTIQTSDKRLKKDIIDLPLALIKAISRLRPVEYRWKEGDNGKHIGFIAQEVEQVFKNSGLNPSNYFVIQHDEQSDMYSLSYTEFIAGLLSYTQQLEKSTEALQQKTTELETRLSALENSVLSE